MNAIRKILVPTDFSAHAGEAFRVAQALAGPLNAEVVLFHVARPPAVAAEDGLFLSDLENPPPVNVWERFHALQPDDPAIRVRHEVIVADRPDAGHVLDILERLGCELIVMGTHGHSWLKHLLFGTLTEQVVRRAHCPVLVVKAPAAHPVPKAPAQTEAARAG